MYPTEYRRMRAETPVTKRHIVTESGSTSSATLTWRAPIGTHSKSVIVTDRDRSESSPIHVTIAHTNAPVIAAVATHPANGSPSLRPSATRTTNPPRANASIHGAAAT